jgi:hypothetical protein
MKTVKGIKSEARPGLKDLLYRVLVCVDCFAGARGRKVLPG